MEEDALSLMVFPSELACVYRIGNKKITLNDDTSNFFFALVVIN